MSRTVAQVIKYDGCNFFRQRIILSILSGRSVKIRRIRLTQQIPGIREYERSLLDLILTFTNGTKVHINETGTSVFFQPGMLSGGEVEFECDAGRSIGYYLEVLMCLAPFCKESLHATLKGVTADKNDPSVDRLTFSSLPILKKFTGEDEGLKIEVIKRGAAPEGGGKILFTCPRVPKLSNVTLLDQGKVWKIRGCAWSIKMSTDVKDRIIDSSRKVLTRLLADVRIYKDPPKKSDGRSPGYGLILWAETKTGVTYTAEVVSNPKGSSEGPSSPDELGTECALALLNEIQRGGCVDSSAQSLACLMMALRDKDVSKVKMGQLTDYTIGFLRNIRDFFGVTFRIEDEESKSELSSEGELLKTGDQKYLLKCSGIGYRNLNRVVL